MAMAPPATRYHHQLRVNRLPPWVIILPVLLLRHLPISLELIVGGNVSEELRIIDIRLRQCLGLFLRGRMGHAIYVVHLRHICIIKYLLKYKAEY